MNRRDFVKAGVLATFAPSVLSAMDKKSTKKCVYVFLGGGISHIEFLNPCMDAPIEFQSFNGSVKTKTGYEIGGTFTELAKCSDLFTSVRSLHHQDANHYTAAHWIQTSHAGFGISENGKQKEPFYGTIVNYEHNPNASTGIPHFIRMNRIPHDDPAWLGSKYMGYDNDSEATKNLKLENRDRFLHKTKMMQEINRQSFKVGNNSEIFKAFDETKSSSLEIILGETSLAFNMDLESEASKLQYKIATSGFGKNLLMARRLLEHGSKFISLDMSGWDTHSNMAETFNTRGKELDSILSIFLQDLNQRGLLKDTLVVVCSEFGRTPKQNNNNGKDHYNSCNSLLLAGGKNYGGSVIGRTDDKGTEVTDKSFSPFDLCWTILNHFDIDKTLKITDKQGRPRYIVDKEAKLIV